MDTDEAVARLRSARVGRLATVRPDGRPHVVPLVFALVEGSPLTAYWAVDAKPKRSLDLQRVRNLGANPAVELVVDGYDEDWGRLWWVRASGTGRPVDDTAERTRALAALRQKYPQYEEAPPDGPVFAIEIDAVKAWEGAD
jgi:PPOX class probable F420-dependent enzyme